MNNELFERELQNTSINDVSLADYVKENYLPIEVLDKIRAEIEKPLHGERCFDTANAKAQYIALSWCIDIINRYKAKSEHKCHTCKHYTSGEYDGSCDSYVCEHYSDWESEG